MSTAGEFWRNVREQAEKTNMAPVMVSQVISLKPFIINYQGVEIGSSYGDTVYLNNLLLEENINLDLASMDSAQNFDNSTAYQSPNFIAEVSGTQKQFLIDFYNWTKAFHNRFIIHQNDLVSVQQLANNTYIILGKAQQINEQ